MARAKKPGRKKGARSKGWRVTRHGDRCTGWVRIAGGYDRRSFKGPQALANAEAWAQREAARIALSRHLVGDGAPVLDTARLVEGYLADLTRRGRRPKTVHDAQQVLDRWAVAVPRMGASSLALTEQWIDRLRSAGRGRRSAPLSPPTRNRYRVTIKGLVGWAMERRLLQSDPIAGLGFERQDQGLRAQFSLEELRTIARAVDARLWLRCCLMLYAGLRHDEAVHLRWRDVDLPGRVLMVRLSSGAAVKRRKERIVPILDELSLILARQVGAPDDQVAGPHGGGNPSRDFQAFLDRLKLPAEGRTAHSLRHAYAGLQTASGQPSLLLAAYMGHETAATTKIYVELSSRYAPAVGHWQRGQFELLTGWRCLISDRAG